METYHDDKFFEAQVAKLDAINEQSDEGEEEDAAPIPPKPVRHVSCAASTDANTQTYATNFCEAGAKDASTQTAEHYPTVRPHHDPKRTTSVQLMRFLVAPPLASETLTPLGPWPHQRDRAEGDRRRSPEAAAAPYLVGDEARYVRLPDGSFMNTDPGWGNPIVPVLPPGTKYTENL